MNRAAIAFVAAALIIGAPAAAAPAPAASIQGVVLTVRCTSNPERLTIRNDRSKAFTITRVGSTRDKRDGEPFAVSKRLYPGKSITYTFGTGRGPNKVTNQFIFDNEDVESARIVTSLGAATKRCNLQ